MNRKSQSALVSPLRLIGWALGLLFATTTGFANAATQTANLDVSATVSANCSITTAAVAFGTYDPVITNATTALDSTGTITTTCTNGASVTILLGQGSNANTGSTDAAPERRMLSGANYLNYQLYSDTSRTVVWGNDTTTDVAETGTGSAVNTTVYGSVPAGQNVPAGTYSDTVVATVSF